MMQTDTSIVTQSQPPIKKSMRKGQRREGLTNWTEASEWFGKAEVVMWMCQVRGRDKTHPPQVKYRLRFCVRLGFRTQQQTDQPSNIR